jgi:benzoyl-CoA reductase/2-hydroxyglutaryl-CoA dehydratase subunit BcrC/BadD/HgdB
LLIGTLRDFEGEKSRKERTTQQIVLFLGAPVKRTEEAKMKIIIPNEELKEDLEERLGAKVSKQLLEEFIGYLEIDLPQWVRDNLKSFELKLVEEGRI